MHVHTMSVPLMHTWTHRAQPRTPVHGHREACDAGVPLHILTSTRAPTLRGVLARPGPKVAVFTAEECKQLGTRREGEVQGKPHGQESGQACQAEAGLSGTRNCAGGGGASTDTCSQSLPSPVSSESRDLEAKGSHRPWTSPLAASRFSLVGGRPCLSLSCSSLV